MSSVADEKAPDSAPDRQECETCKRPKTCPSCQKDLDPVPKTAKDEISLDKEVLDVRHQLPPLPNPLPRRHPEFLSVVPPHTPTYRKFSVFLAGSIEMGNAIQWQNHMTTHLQDLPITVLNPRRGKWPNVEGEDNELVKARKKAGFREQVGWEMEALERASVICFFFDVTTKSPVTLCELGLHVDSDKVVVCCGEEYWREGNVDFVCEKKGIPKCSSFAELVPLIKAKLKTKGMAVDGMSLEAARERLEAAVPKAPPALPDPFTI